MRSLSDWGGKTNRCNSSTMLPHFCWAKLELEQRVTFRAPLASHWELASALHLPSMEISSWMGPAFHTAAKSGICLLKAASLKISSPPVQYSRDIRNALGTSAKWRRSRRAPHRTPRQSRSFRNLAAISDACFEACCTILLLKSSCLEGASRTQLLFSFPRLIANCGALRFSCAFLFLVTVPHWWAQGRRGFPAPQIRPSNSLGYRRPEIETGSLRSAALHRRIDWPKLFSADGGLALCSRLRGKSVDIG